jgi:hypothetical protein
VLVLLVGRKIKRKEKHPEGGSFLPRAEHALLAVPQGIFMAVRCN